MQWIEFTKKTILWTINERATIMTEFITRNYGNKEFEIIIKTDSKEHYKAAEDFARKLIYHEKPENKGG